MGVYWQMKAGMVLAPAPAAEVPVGSQPQQAQHEGRTRDAQGPPASAFSLIFLPSDANTRLPGVQLLPAPSLSHSQHRAGSERPGLCSAPAACREQRGAGAQCCNCKPGQHIRRQAQLILSNTGTSDGFMSALRALLAQHSLFPWKRSKMNLIRNPLGLPSLQCSAHGAGFHNL